MEGVQNSDVATLSLLNGGVGGYGINGRGYGHEFANDGSNAVRINSNEKLSSQGHDFLSQQISDNADRNRDTLQTLQTNTQFDRVSDKLSDQTDFFNNAIARVADATAVGQAEIIREMNANARAAAECCCEAKLLAVQNQCKTDAGLATILANQACDTRVADAVANATQNAKLDSILAGQSGRGHS